MTRSGMVLINRLGLDISSGLVYNIGRVRGMTPIGGQSNERGI